MQNRSLSKHFSRDDSATAKCATLQAVAKEKKEKIDALAHALFLNFDGRVGNGQKTINRLIHRKGSS